jgi:hypothetical protein
MNAIHPIVHQPRPGKILPVCVCSAALLAAVLAPFPARAGTAADISVEDNRAVADFPNTLTFQLTLSSPTDIERIVLEYGSEQLTCGEVVSKAFPDFEPAERVEAEWIWDMRRSGGEPPGATIWWQWRVTDGEGGEHLVERKEFLWLDSLYPWQSLSEGPIAVHWYEGGSAFGEDMLDSALRSAQHIEDLIDLRPVGGVDLYLYGEYEDMQDSILNEPEWTGGVSYGEYNIILLGVPEGSEEWGKAAIAHELMHTVVDRFAFSCLVRIPSWIHEGLAMVSEGGPDEYGSMLLQKAIDDNELFPLRSLGGGFPEDATSALLAYAQSYSVVDFLIRKGDASRMRSLLSLLAEGTTVDDALLQLYGFNVDGLDAAWRDSVGAEPLGQEETAPTATPTVVPTYPPLAYAPTFQATAARTGGPSAAGDFLPWAESLAALCVCLCCCFLILGAAVIAAISILRRSR